MPAAQQKAGRAPAFFMGPGPATRSRAPEPQAAIRVEDVPKKNAAVCRGV